MLDLEHIHWPFTLPEVQPGQRTPMLTDRDSYRRHELVPGEAYLYLREHLSPHSVADETIRELLGPALAAKRPTRFDVKPRDLQLISDGIAERTMETRPHCVLVIPQGMWNDAAKDTRTIFHNMCRIHRLDYRVENVGIGGAFWDCSPRKH
jgi:hypothetical protein